MVSPEVMTARRILAIDDEVLITFALERKLSLAGYSIKTANDVTRGIALYDSFKPDLVIVDYCMPRLNGIVAVQHIRYSRKHITPVIMLSGTSDEREIANSFELGINAFLGKPIALPHLGESIGQLLSNNTGIHPTTLATG